MIGNLKFASLRMPLPKSAFARNWSLLVVSGLLCQILGVLATLRIARVLAPAGYGQYNLVQATGALGAVFAALGLSKVVIRRCARTPEETGIVLIVAMGMRAVALLGSMVGIIVYERRFGGPLSPSFTLAALLLLIGLNVWDTFESVAFGHELMQYSAAINLAGNVLWLLAAWTAPVGWIKPLTVSVAFAALQFGEALIYIAIATRRGWVVAPRLFTEEARLIARSLMRDGTPFWWLLLLSSATNQLPQLMLGARSGFLDVGLYNAGYRIVGPLALLISTATASLYPGLSRLGQNDHARLATIVSRVLIMIATLGSAGALAISLLRKELIGVMFSERYSAAASVVAIQCWYVVLSSVFTLIGTTLAAIDRQRSLAGLSTCYTVLSLPIIWIGAGMGASRLALAMLVAGFINLSYHWVVLVRALDAPLAHNAAPAAIGLLIAGMAISWLVPPSAPLIARIGLVVLLGIVFSVGAIQWARRRSRATSRPVGVLR